MSTAAKQPTKPAPKPDPKPVTAKSPDKSGTSVVTTPSDREIKCERIFDAPKDKVWRAYTDPKLIAQWWGRGNKLDIQSHELKPGGRWRFVEHSDHGEFGFEGEFREVTPRDRIVQTFGWDGMEGQTIVETAEFHDLGDGRTKIVSTSVFESREDRDGMLSYGMEKGMDESFAALDRLLGTM
jgi:uncharacterized protein YndB with AHSA1/START domain